MMKLVLTVLYLLTNYLSAQKSSQELLPLDMAGTSVDDYFKGCRKDMHNLIMSKYIQYEKNNTPGFRAAWDNALKECVKKGGLSKEQCAAIYLYTQIQVVNPECSYVQFNRACRQGRQAYRSGKFKFYTLYFFLTDAIQRLKTKLTQIFCVTSYRRTNVTFTAVTLNQTIRFGSFISTSLNNNLGNFGNVTCFQIYTCYGAKVQKYSAVETEKEVIIPPYEVFRIKAIRKKYKEKNLWCEVVYELKSAGKLSNLQCAIPKQIHSSKIQY